MGTHVQTAVKNFRKFHGRNPDGTKYIEFTMPKGLTYLGLAVAIEYESDKLLHGVKKSRTYRHKFGSAVKIYQHPNRKWILIGGGKFRVTDWMRD